MEYLLVMILAGGTMTAICFLMRLLLRERIYARLYYLLIKAAVLYYLIPLPFLKRYYREVLQWITSAGKPEIVQVSLTWRNHVVHAEERNYINVYAGLQTTAVCIWLLVACILFVRQMVEYVRITRQIARYAGVSMTDLQRAVLDRVKTRYGVKRPVVLYQGDERLMTTTFGLSHSVIVCSREIGSREAELLLYHEMVHIRRLDVCWKMLVQFVVIIHWCNPMAWLLMYEFERVCELSCDETAMRGKSEEETKEYLNLLIEEATTKEKTDISAVRWRAGFGNNKKYVRERMDNLMKKNKWNRFVASALMAALIFANSMTVFAYRDAHHDEVAEDEAQEEIETALDNDMGLFLREESSEEWQDFDMEEMTEIQYDMQFTDEEGNVYPVYEDEPMPHGGCNHAFASGKYEAHTSYSDGSCRVDVYNNAQRCDKCGYVIRGEKTRTITYNPCPHK